MSALARRQAAQEDVAAARLVRCAALEEAQHVDFDCHHQEVSAVLHSFSAELEAQLAEQLAALRALALRQAAQESAAAAQLVRCAALELGPQAALEELTASLLGYMDDSTRASRGTWRSTRDASRHSWRSAMGGSRSCWWRILRRSRGSLRSTRRTSLLTRRR